MAASPSSEPAYGRYPYKPHEVNTEALRAWSAEQGVPDVGERLLGEIVAGIEAPAGHPDLGRIVPEFDQPFLRELIRPPFRIVYRRDPEGVRIVRVWRSARLLDLPDEEE